MKKSQVISLDPIDRKKKKGFIGRMLITRYSYGKRSADQEPFGHYMWCGRQRKGKSISVLWYLEKKIKHYKKIRLTYIDRETGKAKKFDKPPKIYVYSNMGIGINITREKLFETIVNFNEYENAVRFVLLDEIQVYFKRDSRDKKTVEIGEKISDLFCQLGKRNTYIFSTSQVYGRVDKTLREQCLYMINCTKTITGKFKNEFIDGDDILCDNLGRWAGDPKIIYIHGLPKLKYDTKKIISIET